MLYGWACPSCGAEDNEIEVGFDGDSWRIVSPDPTSCYACGHIVADQWFFDEHSEAIWTALLDSLYHDD